MNTITIEHAGKTYTADIREAGGASLRGRVTISIDGVWAGNGAVSPTGQIEDCAAVLDEGAYEAIEQAIATTKGASAGPVRIARLDVSGAAA